MSKTLIITAHVEYLHAVQLDYRQFDQIICADGGLNIAHQLGLTPTHLIGDYDSTEKPDEENVIILPKEKDMTDTEAAIDLSFSLGLNDITILGGLGGRFDHTMGNIGLLAKYIDNQLIMIDGQNAVFMLRPGTYVIPENPYTYMGIISYGDTAEKVNLTGVKYPLNDFQLNNQTSLGVSNEIIEESATISFEAGKLLVILSKDIDK